MAVVMSGKPKMPTILYIYRLQYRYLTYGNMKSLKSLYEIHDLIVYKCPFAQLTFQDLEVLFSLCKVKT